MAFPVIDGFDLYNSTAAATGGLYAAWTNTSSGGTVSLIAGRFGGQAVRMSDGTGNFASVRIPTGNMSGFAVGVAYRIATLATIGSPAIVQLMDSAFAAQLTINVNASGQVLVYRGATNLITGTLSTILATAWNYIELVGTIADSGGTLELWVNGALHGTFTGDTKNTANAGMDYIQIQAADGSGGGTNSDFDDLYVSDSATRIGERRVEVLRPSADTAQKDFVPSTGTNNAAMVDDTTVLTTDYVQGGTVGNLDLYDLGDMATTPLSIDAVQLVAFALKTDATTRAFALVADLAGTQTVSTDKTLNATIARYTSTMLTKPGGGAWDSAALNALKAGPKVTV